MTGRRQTALTRQVRQIGLDCRVTHLDGVPQAAPADEGSDPMYVSLLGVRAV